VEENDGNYLGDDGKIKILYPLKHRLDYVEKKYKDQCYYYTIPEDIA
jgi:hypothetical protein